MIMQKKFLNKIKDFGLNSYEAKIWTALLSRGISTAGELSDIANVPRSRSYDVLESLEKKGFIILKMGKPIKYIAVSPEEVVERVKKRIAEDANNDIGILEEVRKTNTLKELSLLYKQGIDMVNPTDLSGIIKGRTNISNHLDQMIRNAKKSLIISTTSEGIIRKTKSLSKTLEAAKKRNIDIKIFTPLQDHGEDYINYLKTLGNVKNININNSRFVIVDNKDLVFMLLNDKEVHPEYDTAIWVNTEQFSGALSHLLDNIKN